MIDLGGDLIGNGVSKMVFTILAAVAEGERDRLRELVGMGFRGFADWLYAGASRFLRYGMSS